MFKFDFEVEEDELSTASVKNQNEGKQIISVTCWINILHMP